MPNSTLLLDVKPNGISGDLQLPLNEMSLAWKQDLLTNAPTLVQRMGPQLLAYLQAHMHAVSPAGKPWKITIGHLSTSQTEQEMTGRYQALYAKLWLQPSAGENVRHLTLYYDAIIHQVVTHKMMVAVRQDWSNGNIGQDTTKWNVLGIFGMEVRDNSIPPLYIDLDEGSAWRGFKSMVKLGIAHISEGTDHLLFLLVLLLPAPLIARAGRWEPHGGMSYSLLRIIKIATAFTIGHSLTLLAGALGWLRLPSQPVEVLIAVSILVTAIHALRPLFPGKELWIAAGFGLVHGLAFASVLANLHLDGGQMALSILGFNLGIEAMQLFVIVMIFPWLLLLSTGPLYKWIRIFGATGAGIAAIAWIAERVSGKANGVAAIVQRMMAQSRWMILALACCAILQAIMTERKKRRLPVSKQEESVTEKAAD